MCLLQCCYAGHLKVILDRMVPSCVCLQRDRERLVAGAEAAARQLTLEEILYPPPSWEITEAAATPSRRSSPKVCPVNNLADLFSSDEEEEEAAPYGGGVNDYSVSMSLGSRASSLRSVSHSRRVSFRSPDESDVFIIPARRRHSEDYDDGDEWSCDGGGESSRTRDV